MDLSSALSFASSRKNGVLSTIRRDGRPQLSNIMYVAVDDEFWISLTTSRAKVKNLQRDPRAVLYVPGDDFWNFVVLDGTVALGQPTTSESDAAADELVDYYRRGSGEHPDWNDYRSTMVREGRLLGRFRATSSYGMMQG